MVEILPPFAGAEPMSYESYEPYDEYEQQPHTAAAAVREYDQQQYQQPYEQQQYQQPYEQQYEQQPYQQQQQYEQPYEQPQQYEQSYEQPQQYEQPYERQQYGQQYEGAPYQDQQWAQSGLGWEQQAWNDAQVGGYQQYTQVNELSGTDYQQYQADLPGDLPVPDYPPEYERYPERSAVPDYAEEPSGFPHQRGEDPLPEPEPTYETEPEPAPKPAAVAARNTPAPVGASRGSFGAAGLGAITAVAAIASTGALLVVIALIQAAVAIGWQQAMGAREQGRVDRRATVLAVLIGWAASAAAFKLSADNASVAIPAALGLGFLLLAADQTTRRGHGFGDGERVAGLGISVAGGLFAVLPAGYVVAGRVDSALTGACASAAALGVLCCALLGRNPVRGIVAALVFGAGVGAYAAKALQADGGLQAGALGGAIAALAAATAVGALDRIVAEAEARGSTRIVSQALPVALSAVGALIASAVFR